MEPTELNEDGSRKRGYSGGFCPYPLVKFERDSLKFKNEI